jgi:methylated-DNA-[protein]-cysteine S-methyltransferase
MLFYDIMPSSLGDLLILSSEKGIKSIQFSTGKEFSVDDTWVHKPEELKQVRLQLDEYFSGERSTFDLSLDPEGTVFQKQIWKELCNIPHGQTCTYQDIANAIGKPNACRAIGMANSKNPILIVVPCHRVIGKNGKLTGYAGGLHNKARLLEIENIDFKQSPTQFELF